MNSAKYKFLLSVILGFVIISVVFIGCSSAAQSLTFSQLISQADKYNGKAVTLDAFYFSGFEISALSESVGPSNSGVWRIVPQGTLVWVESGIPQEIYDKLVGQTETPSGYTERIGKLRITGKFETGGKYGHLDAYQYQMRITNAELLDWSPPPAITTGAHGNLQVKVTDLSGKPLNGAKVVSEEQPEGQLKVTGMTDENGIVTFNDIQAGNYQFYVSRFEYTQTKITVTVTGGQTASAETPMAGMGWAPDDIVITPGGQTYRANVHQQGIENPWPPIETAEVQLKNDSDAVYLRYRSNIVTLAGETRNNIFNLRKAEGPFSPDGLGIINLDASEIPPGVKISQEPGVGLPGTSSAILVIVIPGDLEAGEYILKISVNIGGKDYGTVPCTLKVVQDSTKLNS